MSKAILPRALAALLLLSLVVPATLLIAPQKASAQSVVGCLGGLVGLGAGGGGTVAAAVAVPVNSVTANLLNGDTAGSTWASCINQFVITPLIRAAIRALIQKLTANIINWINGSTTGGNGTGQPSYVQNLSGHLQNIGDIQALSFFAQFTANSNSPFAAAITSSLSTNYLQNTNSAGFFAANRDTLVGQTGSAANEQAFLNGNWSQGGSGAWFALTTQNQNNPYMLYQNSQGQLGSLVTGAQSTRLNELNWGNGFLSWCGAAPPPANGSVSNLSTADTCRDKNGNPGQTQTPGTVIAGYANQALVSNGFQELISANDIDSALSAVITALLGQVLGGIGGLFGASPNSANNNSNATLTAQLQNYSTGNNASTPGSPTAILNAAQSQYALYSTSWQTIGAAANAASTAVGSLATFCTASAAVSNDPAFVAVATAEAAAAQNAITGEIAPMLAQAKGASAAAAAFQAMINKVQDELTTGIDTSVDLQTLQSMPPTASEASNAVRNAQPSGGATANPVGSLAVSGGTIVDQMNLLSSNAVTLKISVCVPALPPAATPTPPGGGVQQIP